MSPTSHKLHVQSNTVILRRWEDDWEFKVILSYKVSWRPAWAT